MEVEKIEAEWEEAKELAHPCDLWNWISWKGRRAKLESNSGKEHTNNTNIYGKDKVALDLCGG